MTDPVWNLVVHGKIVSVFLTRLECVEVLDWIGYIGECLRAIGV